MTKIYITVGVPASGKSSWSKERVSRDGVKAIRFSSDDIRNVIPDLTHAEVFGMMQNGVRSCLESGLYDEIYYDATNTNRKRRRGLYRNIKSWDKNAEVIIKFFSVSYEYAKHMNKKRAGSARVPNDVILKMYRQLQVPRLNVDCDRFEVTGIPIFTNKANYYVDNPKRVEDIFDYDMNKYWKKELLMSDVNHDCPPWHLESVFEHINMCIDNSESLNMSRVALWHDLGKGLTKETDESGYSTYRGHADLGAHYYLNYLTFTEYKEKDISNTQLDIIEVIHQHMATHSGFGRKNIKNNRLTEHMIEFLEDFAKIDKMSRITT